MYKSIILTGNKGLIGSFLEKELNFKGYKVIGIDIESDLSDEDTVKSIMKKNENAHILINSFAINDHINKNSNRSEASQKSSVEIFKKYMDINVTSLFSVCEQFIKTRKYGKIINFSSIYGLVSPNPKLYPKNSPKQIGYSTSKSAVISLSSYLATHFSPDFIINTLALGGINNNQNEDFILNYSKEVPLGRMMNISEVMPAILFLLDPQNSYMTGSVLTIDGGYSLT